MSLKFILGYNLDWCVCMSVNIMYTKNMWPEKKFHFNLANRYYKVTRWPSRKEMQQNCVF